MPIASIELTDFTVFRSAKLDLSPGINVLIGENATGKTHVMKALYAMVATGLEHPKHPAVANSRMKGAFRPDEDDLKRLRHRGPTPSVLPPEICIDVRSGHQGVETWSYSPESDHFLTEFTSLDTTAATFIPSREGLAMFEGFIAAYQKRELAFDETYYDLAVSLSANPLRTPNEALTAVAEELESILGGKVVLKGQRFYVRAASGEEIEAPLLSEGMRKLATIVRLLQNGELAPGGLLLWDEPEANLNPKLVVAVAGVLETLASHGIQVVIASHDYLLVETLAHAARTRSDTSTRFFGFVRTEDGAAVEVTGADDLDDLPYNPIRNEFLAHYDRINGLVE